MSDEGKLFIGSLSYDTNEDTLNATFSKYGNISQVDLIRDKETGRSRGFAFVKYDSVDDAKDALTAMDGKLLDGRQIRVDEAGKSGRPRNGNFGGGPRGRFGRSRGGRGYSRGGYGERSGGNGGYSERSYDRSFGSTDRNFGGGERSFGTGYRSGGGMSSSGYRDNRGQGGYSDRSGGGYSDRSGGGYSDRSSGGTYRDGYDSYASHD